LVAVVLLAGIATLLAVETFRHPPEIWSYAVIAPKDEDLIKELNRAGSLGWEVCPLDGQLAANTSPPALLTR
jgi:hypothetical protein